MYKKYPVEKRSGSQKIIKETNKSLIFKYIYENGPISRIKLAKLLDLSPTTISSLVEELIRQGLIH